MPQLHTNHMWYKIFLRKGGYRHSSWPVQKFFRAPTTIFFLPTHLIHTLPLRNKVREPCGFDSSECLGLKTIHSIFSFPLPSQIRTQQCAFCILPVEQLWAFDTEGCGLWDTAILSVGLPCGFYRRRKHRYCLSVNCGLETVRCGPLWALRLYLEEISGLYLE